MSLVVLDEQGNRSLPDEVVISSNNLAPTANAGPDQIGVVNNYMGFDWTGSYDPDGDYVYRSWTITSAPAGSNAFLVDNALIPDLAGTYEIQLIVNDQWGGYSAPDTVRGVVVTPAAFAQIRLGEASTQIGTFDPSAFDAPGHQNSLRNQLAQIVNFIQQGNLPQARTRIDDVLTRTDGWVLRGALDPKGAGQPYAADFIVGQFEQYDIWNRLQEALSYIY